MSNYSKLYWLTRLDNLQSLLVTVLIISIVAIVVYAIIYLINSEWWDDEEQVSYTKKYGKYKTLSLWIAIVTGVLLTFTPTKNELIFIYAGGKTMDFAASDSSLSKIPYQTTKIVSDYLQKQIDETSKK
jgi:hypothetical protein